jgi:hypothetical protein
MLTRSVPSTQVLPHSARVECIARGLVHARAWSRAANSGRTAPHSAANTLSHVSDDDLCSAIMRAREIRREINARIARTARALSDTKAAGIARCAYPATK